MSILRNHFVFHTNQQHSRVIAPAVVALVWISIFCLSLQVSAQVAEEKLAIDWQVGSMGRSASFRGLSVVDDSIVWACGSKGSVVHTLDGGTNWLDRSPVGFEDLEFRSIHAIDAKTVCLASAGTPAVVLRTVDGGKSWSEVFRHDSTKAFFDAMVFWSPTDGLVVSDPIDGRWLMVRTEDGGLHWRVLEGDQAPMAVEGEAAFAASNGSLSVIDAQRWWLGTGGKTGQATASLLQWSGTEKQWIRRSSPLATSESSGIFAVEFARYPLGVIVGGDYKKERDAKSSAAWTEDGGKTWQEPLEPLSGYRSTVIDWQRSDGKRIYVAVGPSGTDLSDDGKRWRAASSIGFHAARSSAHGRLWAVGSDGRVGWAK